MLINLVEVSCIFENFYSKFINYGQQINNIKENQL